MACSSFVKAAGSVVALTREDTSRAGKRNFDMPLTHTVSMSDGELLALRRVLICHCESAARRDDSPYLISQSEGPLNGFRQRRNLTLPLRLIAFAIGSGSANRRPFLPAISW